LGKERGYDQGRETRRVHREVQTPWN
jgi:hypothetical protein